MVPFRVDLKLGSPVHEQVAFAARKAMISGKLRPGDPFPSVRALSKAVKIHANTAQKVVGQLVSEGLLEVRPGVGTVVAQPPAGNGAGRKRLLIRDVEQLVVEAIQVGLTLEELQTALAETWRDLQGREGV